MVNEWLSKSFLTHHITTLLWDVMMDTNIRKFLVFCTCLSTVTATLIVTMATNVDRHRYWLHCLKQQMQFLSLPAKLQSDSPYDHIWFVALWTKPLNPTWKKMQWNNASSQMNEFWKKADIFSPLTLIKSMTICPLFFFFFFDLPNSHLNIFIRSAHTPEG